MCTVIHKQALVNQVNQSSDRGYGYCNFDETWPFKARLTLCEEMEADYILFTANHSGSPGGNCCHAYLSWEYRFRSFWNRSACMRVQENLSNFSWTWPISGMGFASWMNSISSVKVKTCTYTCTWQTRLLHSLESWRHAPCALINKPDFRAPEWRRWNHCFWSHLRNPIYSSFPWEKSISMIFPKPQCTLVMDPFTAAGWFLFYSSQSYIVLDRPFI